MHWLRTALPLPIGAALLSGCGDWLARNNPCGGIYDVPGTAETTAEVSGDMQLGADDASFATTDTSGRCDVIFSGSATPDDTGKSSLYLTCGAGSDTADLVLTFPDVRPLGPGDQVDLPTTVKVTGTAGGCSYDATAKLRITHAAGEQAESPSFVTPDFVRQGTFTLAAVSGSGPSGASTCPVSVAVHATVRLDATSYTQGTTSGTDHCPDLPSK